MNANQTMQIQWRHRNRRRYRDTWRPTAGFLFEFRDQEEAREIVLLANRTNRKFEFRLESAFTELCKLRRRWHGGALLKPPPRQVSPLKYENSNY